ncbi:MAG: CopG family transcriptional regulator [Gammaproteobacteria bacterium]|nr:CopG family transcriptional regulator [Gammaproteobacteria bacterium]MXW44484.1 CopG family transcriptional regulator [Gammaproteobacteria bacterium]MYD01325.1 CopG family transcriptional regulator [Gammaproteobacteria bacterium]MYI24645.1 CopG family transcriptional regulator [Gammaproteobacteria bacterium]
MTKSVTLRLDEDVYTEFREAAVAERRPIPNLIETAALERIRETQFVDETEAAEILSDRELIKRLEAGSRQARERTGKFVE